MAVPSYRFFMDPLLRYLAKRGSSVRPSDAHDAVAEALGLTDEERAAEVPTGMKTYRNRTSWAFNTLKHSGLVELLEDGSWRLSPAGHAVANAQPGLSQTQVRQLVAAVKRSTNVGRPRLLSAQAISPAASVVLGNKKAYRLPPRPLASGGQADVYEAERKSDGRVLIFKRAKNFMAAKRMRREIQVQRSLNHVYIMPVLDWDSVDFSWYVMPKGIRCMSDIGRPVPPRLLCAILRAIASALGHAHTAGYPHRDVKPQNIIELSDGNGGSRWVLADWGLTRRALGETTTGLTKSGGLGTEGYAPPESYQDAHEVGPAGDIYSLGQVIAWATGVDPIPNISPRVAAPWSELTEPMTRQIPEERPQGVSEVLDLLDRVEVRFDWMSQ